MISDPILNRIQYCIQNNKKIAFLVGAGISAESGIPTFRGEDGYWTIGSENYKAQEIGTKKFFNVASYEVQKFYLFRKSITASAQPNKSHHLLKEIEDVLEHHFALISQNVDGLHKKAGNSSSTRTFLIHGDHDYMRCADECTNTLYPFPDTIDLKNRSKDQLTPKEIKTLRCPKCGDELRPHVLWFDEEYNEKIFKKDSVLRISKETGILFVIGTSGETNLPQIIVKNVLAKSGTVVEVNINESHFSKLLQTKKNGFIINSRSTPFLQALKTSINTVIHSIKKY